MAINNKNLTDLVLQIGRWLESNDYRGTDVVSTDKSVECSTTLSFSAVGWLNLYRKIEDTSYLQKAIVCADRIVGLQDEYGSWSFPFKFRNNLANHHYACETLFTALVLPDLFTKTGDEIYLDSAMKAKDFLIKYNGFQKISENEYCLWYSPTDKIHVPNLGSFAGDFFSKLYRITKNEEDYQLARAFALFCVKSLKSDGKIPYYKLPCNKELVDLQSYSYDLFSHRVNSVEELSDIFSTAYHALCTFEIDKVYNIIKEDTFRVFILKTAEFLRSLQKMNGILLEKGKDNGYSLFAAKKRKNIRVTSIKTLAWSMNAFLAAGKYMSKYHKNAYRVMNYLIDKCMDEDGSCRYFVYRDGSTKESDRFARGTAILFEAITNFV